MKDYYAILGVLPTAEDFLIKAAYRAKAQNYHPDKWKGSANEANQKMGEINEAYSVLGDVEKRKAYDRNLAHSGSVFSEQSSQQHGNTKNGPEAEDVVGEFFRRAKQSSEWAEKSKTKSEQQKTASSTSKNQSQQQKQQAKPSFSEAKFKEYPHNQPDPPTPSKKQTDYSLERRLTFWLLIWLFLLAGIWYVYTAQKPSPIAPNNSFTAQVAPSGDVSSIDILKVPMALDVFNAATLLLKSSYTNTEGLVTRNPPSADSDVISAYFQTIDYFFNLAPIQLEHGLLNWELKGWEGIQKIHFYSHEGIGCESTPIEKIRLCIFEPTKGFICTQRETGKVYKSICAGALE